MFDLPQIKSKGTFSDKTYEVLKKAIIELELKPGKIILEEELATQLGVSRTPIRTALTKLENDNLIEHVAGSGTIVSKLDKKAFKDITILREALEGVSARLAATERNEQDIIVLDNLYNMQKSMQVDKENLFEFFRVDIDFHSKIASISKNKFLENQVRIINTNYSRYLFAFMQIEFMPIVIHEHDDILSAIKEKNPEKAEEKTKNHLREISIIISDFLSKR